MLERGHRFLATRVLAGIALLQDLFSSATGSVNGFEHVLARQTHHSSRRGITKRLRRRSTCWGGAWGRPVSQAQESARRREQHVRNVRRRVERMARAIVYKQTVGIMPFRPGNVCPTLRRIRAHARMAELGVMFENTP